MFYDLSPTEQIAALHDEAEYLAGLAKNVTDDRYAAELRARADGKVRVAARIRAEAGL